MAVFIFATSLSCLFSEDAVPALHTNLGLYGGINLNMHSPSFTLPVPEQNSAANVLFDNNSTSAGFNLGFIGNFPINEHLVFSGRLGYNGLGGTLKSDEIVDAYRNHELKASLHYLELSPVMQFHNYLPVKPLYFLAGLEFGLPLSLKYDYSNTSASPASASAISESGVEIKSKAIRLAIALGAGYTFNVGDAVFLTPEASFRLPLTKVSSFEGFDSWSVPQLRIGVNLTFGLEKKTKTVVKESTPLKVGFEDVRGYDKQRKAKKLSKITVEETQYTELFPLLPYVFFDEQKAVPSESSTKLRAQNAKGSFAINNLEPDALEINKSTLDIVGSRMQANKNASLTLTGTVDAKKESPKTGLAKERAAFAKDYLVNNYGIEDKRIETGSTGLPEKASAPGDPDGIQENRRVEIASSTPDILEPIMIQKDKQRLAEPDLIELVPYAESSDSLASWFVEVLQAGRQIKKVEGKGEIKPVQIAISPNQLSEKEIPLDYTFTAVTKSGEKATASGSVPVDYISTTRKKTEDRPDRTISKFSLVVFDFDSPKVSESDKQILEKFVLPAIKFNSTVQIYGYTDRIGYDSYNKKLSMERAQNVKAFLESKLKSVKYEVYGVGESVKIFDNDLPAGRQLSRTVQVYVITPKS